MNKMFKKFAVMMTTLALTMSCALPAFAATTDTIDTTATGSLTIHKYDMTVAEEQGVNLSSFTSTGKADAAAESALATYAIPEVEFTYLRVGAIETHTVSDSNKNTTHVIYGIDSTLMGILGLSDNEDVTSDGSSYFFTSDQLINSLAGKLSSDNTAAKNALENYIKTSGGTAMSLTDASGETSVSGLPVGLYLVVETRVPENVFYTTDPFLVSIPSTDVNGDDWFYDVEVYPKNQTDEPTIQKLVAEEGIGTFADTVSVSEGDVIDYTVYSHLPKVTSEASYLTKYTMVDTAAKGLTYAQDSVVINFYETEDAAINGDPSDAIASWNEGNKFTATFAGSESADHTMTIAMSAAGLKELNTNAALSEAYLAVQYQMSADSSAEMMLGDEGNKNDVTLTWARTNTAEEQTITDRSVVYTFGIDLTKTFEGGNGDATEVQFVLYNSTDNYYVTAVESAAGLYYVTGKAATEAEGTVFSPSSDGSLQILGMEEDTYVLTEIATDDGFSLLKDDITLVYTCTVPTIQETLASRTGIGTERGTLVFIDGADSTLTVDSNEVALENGLATLTVVNTHSFTLPQTGGDGLWMATISGICLAGFGFFLLFGKKRSEEEA